jgi:hypothetical protein
MPGASCTEKVRAKLAVSRVEIFRGDSGSGQVEDDRLERLPLIPKGPQFGSGDCPERLVVLAAQNLNRSDRVYLDSTRSRHPSARMATARGVGGFDDVMGRATRLNLVGQSPLKERPDDQKRIPRSPLQPADEADVLGSFLILLKLEIKPTDIDTGQINAIVDTMAVNIGSMVSRKPF